MFGQYNTSLDESLSIYSWYTGGGFQNMSGFEPNSLVGQHYGKVMAGYRYQVGKSGFLPGYAGNGNTLKAGSAERAESASSGGQGSGAGMDCPGSHGWLYGCRGM